MKKYIKKIIIIIVIVLIISFSEILTKSKLNNILDILQSDIEDLEQNLYSSNDLESKISEIKDEWEENTDLLSYFVEHNELEEISELVVEIKSYIESNDKNGAYRNIQELKFMIEHIREKNDMKLNNLF